MERAIVAVVGSTGQQGGAVVLALLKQGKFRVRALTRNPESAAARDLAQRGVEVVRADLSDAASLEQAFSGAAAVFLMTLTDVFSPDAFDKELQQGRNAIDAARKAGVKHFVWSGFEDPRSFPGFIEHMAGREVSPGHFVPHMEAKGAVTEYLKSTDLPYTVLLTSLFMENFTSAMQQYEKQEDGSFTFGSTANARDKAFPWHAVEDIGATAAVALADPEKYIGKSVPVVREFLDNYEIAAILSRVTGKTIRYIDDVPDMPPTAPGGAVPPMRWWDNLWIAFRDFTDIEEARPLNGAIVKGISLEEWAQAHKAALLAKLQ